jgi:hypothetical protein
VEMQDGKNEQFQRQEMKMTSTGSEKRETNKKKLKMVTWYSQSVIP